MRKFENHNYNYKKIFFGKGRKNTVEYKRQKIQKILTKKKIVKLIPNLMLGSRVSYDKTSIVAKYTDFYRLGGS
jgi:hypothetical protein